MIAMETLTYQVPLSAQYLKRYYTHKITNVVLLAEKNFGSVIKHQYTVGLNPLNFLTTEKMAKLSATIFKGNLYC